MVLDKKEFLNIFLDTITSASDIEYQKRVWIEGRGPECEDFGEFINNFSDEWEIILKDYKNFGLTEAQYQILSKFHDKVMDFADNYYYEINFLNHEKWQETVEMANEVLKAFNYQKTQK